DQGGCDSENEFSRHGRDQEYEGADKSVYVVRIRERLDIVAQPDKGPISTANVQDAHIAQREIDIENQRVGNQCQHQQKRRRDQDIAQVAIDKSLETPTQRKGSCAPSAFCKI